VIKRIYEGKGTHGDIELLESAAGQIAGHTICAFGEASAWPVQGILKHWRHEFEHYVEHGRSPVEAAA
jgi:NADH-quinone oxidoreductase subunit F